MDWHTQVVSFGLVALVLFIGSVVSIRLKKFFLGLVFGLSELAAATVSSYHWAWALKVSGKTDWLQLGLFSYPLAGLIFWSMLVVGVLCFLVNFFGLAIKADAD